MANDRTGVHATAAFERRPSISSRVQRPAIQRSPAPLTLQQRVGNRASQAMIARAMASQSKETEEKKKHPAVNVASPKTVQTSKWLRLPGKVSKAYDPAELEAEETARKVMRMQTPPAPAPKPQPKATTTGAVQRAEATHTTPAPAPAPAASSSRVSISGGSPLPKSVRGHMEPRFGANFGNVRVHTGETAANQSAHVNAHAFTVGDHIFFGKNKYDPDSASGKELIAHELTHTIQQQAVVQRQVDTTVTQRSEPRIQRLGIGDALDWIADKANYLPGFRLLTIVLGVNPINMAPVDRSAANVLRALLEMIPVTGALIAEALERYGILGKVGAWVEGQIRTLGMVGSQLKAALMKFLDSLSWTDIFDLDDVYERGKRIFTEPITRLIDFGKSLVGDILGFIREAILLPLARLAENTRGYDLLKAVLGEDPITGEPVPRTPETLIGGFMKFIGEEEIWENMKKANAIPRAWAWFQGALQGLMGFVRQIPTLFMNALKSLEIVDLILPPKAFIKVASAFGGFAVQFVTWAGNTIWTLLEIIFDVVSPGALAYIKKTGAALKSILKNPMPFVLNLVRAAKLGFQKFADNIGTHLKTGLIDWLTGALEGVYIPKALSLPELGKFALSVLGISWARIRAKIVKALGPNGETIMKVLETGFDIVVALVTGGPAAAWELIKDKLTELKDQVVSGIIGFVTDAIVKKAIPKLIAMFIPGAGFISAIISIYDTIMVFVEKISKIIQVVKAFIDSIVAIAGGNITAAANRVESVLSRLLSLAISFLAGFLGLGKITDKIKEIIEKVRAKVDQAIDAVIAWIVDKAKALFAKGKAAVGKLIGWAKSKFSFKAGDESHTLYFQGEGAAAKLVIASDPRPVEAFLDEKASEAKGNKAQEDAIKAVRALIIKVDKLTAKAAPDDEKVQKEIESLMNEMGGHLVLLLATGEWGTEKNPAAFDYPKRRAEAYPTFYLATGTLTSLSQSQMKAQYEAGTKKGGQIFRYVPTAMTDVPDKSQKLGLGAASQIEVGKKVFFEDKEARGSGVPTFKKLVGKFGFVASESGWDVDHVVELQIGGKDEYANMWPLPKGENRSSGATIKGATIEIPATKEQKGVKSALEEKKKGGKGQKPQEGLWLLIKSTRQL
ncbi:MAG TPA: DUF4157 domain-containing protein [Pyrinomonadaceae bacterium]|nr:DUF4157 domain-containing protein [Pyrinomonadaceae bacterium]